MELLKDALQSHVRASKVRLSYVDELFPDLKGNSYIVLHKNVPGTRVLDYEKNEQSFDECSMRHDISGSPLEYSFGNCEFDDTIIITKQNWRKEEELYLPLSRTDASTALNACLECLDSNTLPILALCDGKDLKQSRLIGAIVSEDWFTTLEAVSTGMTSMTTIKNECHKIIQEHLKQSLAQEQDIKISVFNAVDVFGIRQETIDWNKTVKSDFEGSISVETYSTSLDLRLPKSTLIVEINAAWKDSPLKELRCQLFLLSQYLSTIDEYKKNVNLQNPIKFATPYLEEHDIVIEKLNFLLNGDFSFRKSINRSFKKINHVNKEDAEIDIKLLERVQSVSLRYDMDFTDFLWEILIKSSEYPQMTNYIETVLKEILEHKFTPQINDTNSTRFVKHLYNLHHQETISHLLMGSIPLELIVDMGFKKLARDYLHILRGAQLINLCDIRQKLNNVSFGIFNTENYRKKMVTLAQIHICLECMLLIEGHLECSTENLQSLFAYAYKKFVSESPLQHYNELNNRIFTLTVLLPNMLANNMNKIDPSVWRASISSYSAASKLTTTTYYSKLPIFPINLFSTDDVDVQEEMVHGISATSSSTKCRKL